MQVEDRQREAFTPSEARTQKIEMTTYTASSNRFVHRWRCFVSMLHVGRKEINVGKDQPLRPSKIFIDLMLKHVSRCPCGAAMGLFTSHDDRHEISCIIHIRV
ncbi:hypothetical protein D6C93_07154 [Aureobasidium pullulans]|uniref:Uncharacterized protein n=1 Tax=Aureobasidium pullulans TaxID=5580 RepID=A0A4S8VMH3_AURPU|nr:hypothetical protein D6D26_09784 [Aureobasidium pullulans]THW12818.1 hypothetical protein D6D24_06376 [Aureobasidium pullulans]THY03489.1 hypothetical protein D6D03_04329 [Aureobasidium pullulans]THY88693.1 hypothetical protein D6C93_07154 [Aureobasidium pullulans]